mmetsp:Transcript_147079/g.273923  ORF Transcript_147079/g.273923 Transcript_147079/m.273923 type:complete len:162 (-) Transcript_147079:116-601(-)
MASKSLQQTQPSGNGRIHRSSAGSRTSSRSLSTSDARGIKKQPVDGHSHVIVYSRSASTWLDGKVVEFPRSDFVRVEYEFDNAIMQKDLHCQSEHLNFGKEVKEHDPKLWGWCSNQRECHDCGCIFTPRYGHDDTDCNACRRRRHEQRDFALDGRFNQGRY